MRRLPCIWFFATCCLGASTWGDIIVEMNELTLDAIRFSSTPPPKATRGLAMVHLAIYDAVNAITGEGSPYLVSETPAPGTSAEAAAVAAVYTMQRNLWPEFTTVFEAAYEGYQATLPQDAATTAGYAWGRSVANQFINHRLYDGSSYVTAYDPRSGLGYWQETPPDYQSALLPQWASLAPFAMESPDQFRPPPPPPLDSAAWAEDVNEVKAFGARHSTLRTADQSEIAWFWADNPGTVTPPGHWNRIAQNLAHDLDLPLWQSARLFALLNLTLADAAIVSWDSKYTYELWRPHDAIRHADLDGNPATIADPDWESLVENPPFPEYVSGHSTFSGAAAALLAGWLGTDTYAFSIDSEGAPGSTRTFDSFSSAAHEAGISRIYGGIHFQSANREGLNAGKAVAAYVLINYLVPWSEARLRCTPAEGAWRLNWPRCLQVQSSPDLSLENWTTLPEKSATHILSAGDAPMFFRLIANPVAPLP